jgi:hypothetical protein
MIIEICKTFSSLSVPQIAARFEYGVDRIWFQRKTNFGLFHSRGIEMLVPRTLMCSDLLKPLKRIGESERSNESATVSRSRNPIGMIQTIQAQLGLGQPYGVNLLADYDEPAAERRRG